MTVEESYQKFLSDNGLTHDPKLEMAFHHGFKAALVYVGGDGPEPD